MGYTWDNFDEGEFRSASDGRRNQSVGILGAVDGAEVFCQGLNLYARAIGGFGRGKEDFFCEEDGGGRPNPYSCTGATVVVLIVVVVLVMMVAVAPATVVVLVVVLVMVTMVAVAMVIVVSC